MCIQILSRLANHRFVNITFFAFSTSVSNLSQIKCLQTHRWFSYDPISVKRNYLKTCVCVCEKQLLTRFVPNLEQQVTLFNLNSKMRCSAFKLLRFGRIINTNCTLTKAWIKSLSYLPKFRNYLLTNKIIASRRGRGQLTNNLRSSKTSIIVIDSQLINDILVFFF